MANATIEHALPLALTTLRNLRDSSSAELSDVLTMQAWETDFMLHSHYLYLVDSVAEDALDVGAEPPVTDEETQALQSHRAFQTSLTTSLDTLLTSLRGALAARVAAAEGAAKPRLYRLAARVGLSDRELRALVFILLSNANFDYALPCCSPRLLDDRRQMLAHCRLFAGLDGRAFLDFLSPERAHFKEGLLEIDEQFARSFNDTRIYANREVLRAVYGCALTVDEQMKLGTSALSRVMAEERGDEAELDHANEEGEGEGEGARAKQMGTEEPTTDSDAQSDGALPSTPGLGDTTDTASMQDLISQLREADVANAKPSKGAQNGVRSKAEEDELSSPSDDEASGTDLSEPLRVAEENDEAEDAKKSNELLPYKDDLEYLSDGFDAVEAACKAYDMRNKTAEDLRYSDSSRNLELMQRVAEEKLRKASNLLSKRVALTKKQQQAGGFIPRTELLVDKLKLTHFERMVLLTLVGAVLSEKVQKALNSSTGGYSKSVGKMLRIYCNGDLREEITSRAYFYRNATLVRAGIISISPRFRELMAEDLAELSCEIDHMVLEYIAGLETELHEIMDNARCYKPRIELQSVIIHEDVKKMVIQRAENFELFRRMRKELGFDDIVRYGKGLTICFHGKSGTGKTLFANALAAHLGKKVLLVNFASMQGKASESDAYKIIFREAKIQGAVIFMDECDDMFVSRDMGGGGHGGGVTSALREMEMFDGIMILATNRPQVLDEAMHRRIAMSVLVEPPNAKQRLAIWRRHVPKHLQLAEDVDFKTLALEFELTGGYIKNAMFQALSSAVTRASEKLKSKDTNKEGHPEKTKSSSRTGVDFNSKEVIVTMDDLREACRMQTRGDLKRAQLENKIVPESGLETLVAPDETIAKLRTIVATERVRGHLTTQWGFKQPQARSACVLLLGPSGCGKSYAASCLGYETGRPLQQIAASKLHHFSAENGGMNMDEIFSQAAVEGAIVVVEEAEQLLLEATSPLTAGSPVLELLFNMRYFDGLVLLNCTTALLTSDAGWDASLPVPNRVASLLSHVVWLKMPSMEMRVRLWKHLIPKKTPVEQRVFDKLPEVARKYEFTGARISACVRRSAAAAAVRRSERELLEQKEGESGECEKVRVEDVIEACEAELSVVRDSNSMSEWMRHLYA